MTEVVMPTVMEGHARQPRCAAGDDLRAAQHASALGRPHGAGGSPKPAVGQPVAEHRCATRPAQRRSPGRSLLRLHGLRQRERFGDVPMAGTWAGRSHLA
jgi:hypothetical protein